MNQDPIKEIDGPIWKKELNKLEKALALERDPQKIKDLKDKIKNAKANLRYIYGCSGY